MKRELGYGRDRELGFFMVVNREFAIFLVVNRELGYDREVKIKWREREFMKKSVVNRESAKKKCRES